MDKMVMKGLEIGLGVASMTANALNEAVKVMEKKGKLSHKDGEKIVRATIKSYQDQSIKYAKNVRSQMNSMMKKAPFATKKEMDDLDAKINKVMKEMRKYAK